MTLCWIIFLFVHLSILIHTQNLVVSGQNCDSQNKKGQLCCTNYALIEGVCTPCVGTFGDNCSGGPCPNGYYGFGCKSKCICSTQQQCDRFKGCTNLTAELEKENQDTPDEGNENFGLIPVMSTALFLVILILTSIIAFKRRTIFMTKVSGLRSSRNLNHTNEISSDPGEDISQMVRSLNNYNILSFNRRLRAISTVNAPNDEGFYDDMASVSSAEKNDQETYVTAQGHNSDT
ncbi:uncharacterized protein LOC111099208 [Crassostrea virginica]